MTTIDPTPEKHARSPRLRRLGVPAVAVAAVLAAVLAVGLFLFQPWRIFTNRTVAEPLPSAAPVAGAAAPAAGTPGTTQTFPMTPRTTPATPEGTVPPAPTAPATAPGAPEPAPATSPATPPADPPAGPVELARGDFISHEHGTSGTARLLQLADGSRVLRIEGLDTSDGPDLRVWLTDAPVIEGRDGWFVFDDGAWLDLGDLKGNRGDANYPVPPDADIDDLTSVSIWCRRFAVSFGAAELAPVA